MDREISSSWPFSEAVAIEMMVADILPQSGKTFYKFLTSVNYNVVAIWLVNICHVRNFDAVVIPGTIVVVFN